ncbi:hypothetical protein BegalDRAFT_1487 [Beggiatoa alba B18LD]|uniref:Uncharacterized protein n=1 Tax=Beggiatoa alba B18LD TaxID=395493 RepID=I3CFI1_9GAMM|nr:hypothetical protein [Beggiatoa alba]EIJ42374.1 hypothetical protein BegalDRAFT_1487 [Beggiatoa alba B18LD]
MANKTPHDVTTQADEIVAVENQLQATLSRELKEFRLVAEQLKGSLVDFHQQSAHTDEWMNDILQKADLLYQDSLNTFANENLKVLHQAQITREISEKTKELEAQLSEINQLKNIVTTQQTDYSEIRDQQEIERLESELHALEHARYAPTHITKTAPKTTKELKDIDLSLEAEELLKKLKS